LRHVYSFHAASLANANCSRGKAQQVKCALAFLAVP
jgi:hypothetical protein